MQCHCDHVSWQHTFTHRRRATKGDTPGTPPTQAAQGYLMCRHARSYAAKRWCARHSFEEYKEVVVVAGVVVVVSNSAT